MGGGSLRCKPNHDTTVMNRFFEVSALVGDGCHVLVGGEKIRQQLVRFCKDLQRQIHPFPLTAQYTQIEMSPVNPRGDFQLTHAALCL